MHGLLLAGRIRVHDHLLRDLRGAGAVGAVRSAGLSAPDARTRARAGGEARRAAAARAAAARHLCPVPGPAARQLVGARLNSSHLVISYAVFCLKKKIYIYWSRPSAPSSPRTDRTTYALHQS